MLENRLKWERMAAKTIIGVLEEIVKILFGYDRWTYFSVYS